MFAAMPCAAEDGMAAPYRLRTTLLSCRPLLYPASGISGVLYL
jgi:hypothetical protein